MTGSVKYEQGIWIFSSQLKFPEEDDKRGILNFTSQLKYPKEDGF